jgi:hypothetical protein
MLDSSEAWLGVSRLLPAGTGVGEVVGGAVVGGVVGGALVGGGVVGGAVVGGADVGGAVVGVVVGVVDAPGSVHGGGDDAAQSPHWSARAVVPTAVDATTRNTETVAAPVGATTPARETVTHDAGPMAVHGPLKAPRAVPVDDQNRSCTSACTDDDAVRAATDAVYVVPGVAGCGVVRAAIPPVPVEASDALATPSAAAEVVRTMVSA